MTTVTITYKLPLFWLNKHVCLLGILNGSIKGGVQINWLRMCTVNKKDLAQIAETINCTRCVGDSCVSCSDVLGSICSQETQTYPCQPNVNGRSRVQILGRRPPSMNNIYVVFFSSPSRIPEWIKAETDFSPNFFNFPPVIIILPLIHTLLSRP